MNSKIDLNSHAAESAKVYAEAVIEACTTKRVKNPKDVLINADDYPQLKRIPDLEYAIGWLNGCAEAHGVLVDVLFDQATASEAAPENLMATTNARGAKRAGAVR